MRRRSQLLGGSVPILLWLVVSAHDAYTSSNVVPTSNAGQNAAVSITGNTLKDPLCTSTLINAAKTASGTFTGTSSAELILGSGAVDTISAAGGNDCIIGGAGDDSINGGTGTDVCIGGPGTDTFTNCETTVQ